MDGETPLVLMAVERMGWCFNNISRAVQKELSPHYRFKVMPTARIASETCDVLVCFWWDHTLRIRANVHCSAVVTCLYDCLSWHINPDSSAQFRLVLKNTDILACCNEEILAEVKERYGAEVPETCLIEDGVDTTLFRAMPLPPTLSIGWTGNSSRHTPGGPEDLKGLGMVRTAASDHAGIELKLLDAACGGSWTLEEMPNFYSQVSAVVIASAYEGTPNPLLEGMACGRPAISTRVGLASKVIREGENGWLVDRNVAALASAMKSLKGLGRMDLERMSRNARATAQQWSWEKKAKAWLDCLQRARGAAARRGKGIVAPNGARYVAPVVVQEGGKAPTKLEPRNPPRVLLISDVPGWAFHTNMCDLAHYLRGRFEFEHWFVADFLQGTPPPNMADFDVVFCVYHRWNIDHLLPWEKTVGSLRARWFKPETPGPVTPDDVALVNQFRAFHVVTRESFLELEKAKCPNAVYLTNPVNMDRFPSMTEIKDRVVASWNGNAKHFSAGGIDVKAFWSMIVPACAAADVPLAYAEYNTKRLRMDQMPEFYMEGNVALCMSLYEGASNSMMEAMACGQALISTDVGNVSEMRESQLKELGDTGIVLVERNIEALVAALETLKANPGRVREMGRLNREEIRLRWSWSAWADRYEAFLRKGL